MKKLMKFEGVNMKNAGLKITTVALLTILSGCTTTIKEKDNYDKASAIANGNIAKQTEEVHQNNTAVFQKDSGAWFADKPLDNVKQADPELPSTFNKMFSIDTQTSMSVTELAGKITQLTGMPVNVNRDVLESVKPSTGATGATPTGTSPSPTPSTTGNQDSTSKSPTTGTNNLPSLTANAAAVISPINYSGTLKGFFDLISAKNDIFWNWDGRSVHLFAMETKVFHLNALPGQTSTTSTVSTTSGSNAQNAGSSVGGSTGQSISSTSSADLWAEIKEQIKSVMSPRGSLSVVQSTGFVTVTDNPTNMAMVEKQIHDINKVMGKQVMVNVEVYSIDFNQGENYQANWNVLFNQLSSKFNFSLTGNTSLTGAQNLLGITFNNTNSQFNGSAAALSLLNSLGHTNLVTSASLITLNGQSVPLQVTHNVAYLAQVTVTPGANGAQPQAQLTPGNVSEGFVINLTPRITETKDLYLQYSIDLSQIVAINTFTSDGDTLQLPETEVRSFLQRVAMKSGQTLMLTGFKQLNNKDTKAGWLDPSNWFFPGGQKNTNTAETSLVVVITPYVISDAGN